VHPSPILTHLAMALPHGMRNPSRMGRTRRPNQPGGIFHLAARTLDRKRLLTPRLRTRALQIVADVAPGSGARLLAVAIMPNHIHLVAQQGDEPLVRLMQPLLNRLARLIQRSHGLEGPVFWRHYSCQPCMDPNHARNAIVYVNLNPVRAGLCVDPGSYPWTSHMLYADGHAGSVGDYLADVVDPHYALPLFAAGPDRCFEDLRLDYRRYVEWRLAMDRIREHDSDDGQDLAALPPWESAWGNLAWGRTFSPLFHPTARPDAGTMAVRTPRYMPDLQDIARSVLAAEASSVPLSEVKGSGGSAELRRIRDAMIRAMHAAGHRNIEIARFLRTSESTVSRIVRAPRPPHPR
jgi:REP element-mobilizing transposase RayT